MSTRIKAIAVMVALLSITQIAMAVDFTGRWRSEGDGIIVDLTDYNGSVSGVQNTGDFNVTFSGYHVASNKVRFNISRRNIRSGCVTVMYQDFSISNFVMYSHAYGTDGRCDLKTTYTESRVWHRL